MDTLTIREIGLKVALREGHKLSGTGCSIGLEGRVSEACRTSSQAQHANLPDSVPTVIHTCLRKAMVGAEVRQDAKISHDITFYLKEI